MTFSLSNRGTWNRGTETALRGRVPEREGIRLDPDKIEYNPGLRALAKLMLNSVWGKYYAFKCPPQDDT